MTTKNTQQGFTLIELLVVAAMFSIFMMAIYSLYKSQRNTSYAQDEIIEVQQNLRIGMDAISHDLRLAGCLIPLSSDGKLRAVSSVTGTGITQPLPSPNNISSDAITISLASAANAYARISNPVASGASMSFLIDNPAGLVPYSSLDQFAVGDKVRIYRVSQTDNPYLAGWYTIANVNAAANSLLLSGTSTTDFDRRDVIAKVGNTTNPDTITYCLAKNGSSSCNGSSFTISNCPTGQLCLVRIVNGTAQVIAQNMAGLQFRYLIVSGSTTSTGLEVDLPDDANLPNIRAVHTTLTGMTYNNLASGVATTHMRQTTSIVYLRNRR